MKRYAVLHKKVGETPLAALAAWKAMHPEYADVPAAYAGRLDPMAEGRLLILLGGECKRQERYHGLDKEYEVEVLLDAGSDTGDALGLVAYSGKETEISRLNLATALQAERGAHMREYPAFSSKTVNGKPLFFYALDGTLPSIEIPKHEERFYTLTKLGQERIGSRALRARVDAFLEKAPKTDEESKAVGADFRIDAVRASWEKFFAEAREREFVIVKLRIVCGAGAYMRSLAGRVGEALGTNGLALSINRTRIGRYRFGFWTRTYEIDR